MAIILEKAIEHAAREVFHGLSDAAGDMGYSFHPSCCNSKMKKKWDELKADGLSDEICKDAMADYYYDDEDSMHDLAGDRIFDEAQELVKESGKERNELFIMIATEVKKICYGGAVEKAMDKLIAEHVKMKEKKDASTSQEG